MHRRHGGSVPLGALGETTCRTPQHRPTEGQEARHPVPHLEGGPCLFIPGLLQLLEKGARPEVPEVASGVRRCLPRDRPGDGEGCRGLRSSVALGLSPTSLAPGPLLTLLTAKARLPLTCSAPSRTSLRL